jgi:hypothetical protein
MSMGRQFFELPYKEGLELEGAKNVDKDRWT